MGSTVYCYGYKLSVLSGCYFMYSVSPKYYTVSSSNFQFFLVATIVTVYFSASGPPEIHYTFSSFWLLQLFTTSLLQAFGLPCPSFQFFLVATKVPPLLLSRLGLIKYRLSVLSGCYIYQRQQLAAWLVQQQLPFSSFWLLPSLYNSYCHLGGGVVGVFQFFLVATL